MEAVAKMAILIDEKKRVLVQGITGREGRARTRLMLDYGTNVVGGVTPAKADERARRAGVQHAAEAVNRSAISISRSSLSAAGRKEAAIEAIEAGVKLVVLVPDRVPVWDAMEIAAAAKRMRRFLGPNTLGARALAKRSSA